MQFFNSLSRIQEPFSPLDDKKVVMYVCGLTPYDQAHIGHARTYVSFDTIKRYLVKKGYSVMHIQNITDVDDKIIKRCKETGADPKQLTMQNHDEALELFAALNILPANVYPKVTEHIKEIIEIIELLIKRGYAYETDAGVYFKVAKFNGYGTLSGQNMEQINAGARIEVDESKSDPADFALWKKTDGEILEFGSPWGRGRPGWHIECSAMAHKYAKRTLDIHGGARDLIFPHHENEIAQSEAALGQKFCKCWLHTGFLTVSGEKMSKSIGNFITLKQALTKSSPNALRLFYLQAHYRSPLDYDDEQLEAMGGSVERIFNSLGLLREACQSAHESKDAEFREKSDHLVVQFYSHLENDFNTPEALATLFNLLRLSNAQAAKSLDRQQLAKVANAIDEMLWIFGLAEQKTSGLGEKEQAVLTVAGELGVSANNAMHALDLVIELRDHARAAKDYKKSDEIRQKLAKIGITIEDKGAKLGKGGTRWKIS